MLRLAWWRWSIGALGLAFLPVACSHNRMLPAVDARLVPDAPDFAVVEHAGVRVAANGNDWTGRPADLSEHLSPVKVRIVNHSGKPLQILYERFALVGRRGHRYQPLPPVRLWPKGSPGTVASLRPIFATASFFVRPAYRDVYPSIPPWPARLRSDDHFNERQYKLWGEDLPTVDMQRMGLPEGVLADGGEMSGFLYFENATRRENKVLFEADLDEGKGEDRVTSVAIPFRIE